MNGNSTSFFDEQPIFILDQQTFDILDVNEAAVHVYGYSRDELMNMNVNDLGKRKKRIDLIQGSANAEGVDKIWTQQTKDGDTLHVQFTHHTFYHNGRPAKIAIAHDVSEQIDQNETRRANFPKFITHESNFPMAAIEWDANMRVRSWSDKAEELFGWREEEVIGQSNFFGKLIFDGDHQTARKKVLRAVQNQQSYFSAETRVNTKNGEKLICKWHNSLIYDRDKKLYSVHSLITDISGQKQSENLFRALSEESLVGVYLIQDGIFKYVNPRLAEIFEYEREEIIDEMSPLDLTHPEFREEVRENISERINGNVKSKEYDFLCTTKSGRTIHVSVYGTTITYMGKPAIIGTMLDITENKETIRKYQASVKSFQDLFDSISDAIYIQDSEGTIVEVNRGAVEMFGFEQSHFIGETPEILAAPGKVNMEKTNNKIQKALRGEPQNFEWWGKKSNGEVFPMEMVVNPGTYFGQDVIITIARDISERYKAEDQLRKNEEMFRQLFQNSPIAIVQMDKRQEIQRINSAFEDIFGYPIEEIQGLNIDQLLVPNKELEIGRGISEKIFEGETAHHFGKRLCKDGTLKDVLIYGVPVVVDGKTVAIFGIYVDITERKEAEEKIKKSLKEKEVLLAEIHHRVKNNLAVITGLLELQAYNTSSEEATEVLQESQMRVNSIALIHEKLYQNENLSEISFDLYLEQLTGVIVSSLKSSQTEIDITINADPVKLTINQAIPCGLILNEIITNAHKHAFPDSQKGNIDISLVEKDGKLIMKIEDDGVGLPDDISVEKPTSLGLKLIRTLTKQLNGRSSLTNTNSGSRFTLSFTLED